MWDAPFSDLRGRTHSRLILKEDSSRMEVMKVSKSCAQRRERGRLVPSAEGQTGKNSSCRWSGSL